MGYDEQSVANYLCSWYGGPRKAQGMKACAATSLQFRNRPRLLDLSSCRRSNGLHDLALSSNGSLVT